MWSDIASTTESPFGAIGMMIVSGEALDIGVTAIPLPYDQNQDDRWLFHSFWHQGLITAADLQVGPSTCGMTFEIDNKAMRKVQDNDVLVWVIQNKSAAHAALFYWSTRVGFKMP